MNTQNKTTVVNFIGEIWNQNQFDKIDHFIHPAFTDYSLPSNLPSNKEGLQFWIRNTGKSFGHTTNIEEMVSEENKVMLKIRMQMKHIGEWRGIEATGAEIETVGYRYFKLADGKIIEHWALIDGNAIENQLRQTNRGCEIQA
jgi:predicted ester cyclase